MEEAEPLHTAKLINQSRIKYVDIHVYRAHVRRQTQTRVHITGCPHYVHAVENNRKIATTNLMAPDRPDGPGTTQRSGSEQDNNNNKKRGHNLSGRNTVR